MYIVRNVSVERLTAVGCNCVRLGITNGAKHIAWSEFSDILFTRSNFHDQGIFLRIIFADECLID